MKFRLVGIHWTQPRKKKEERGKRKEKVNLKERRSSRSGVWGRKDYALWVWETASDAGEWRDERVRTFFFFFSSSSSFSCFGPVCIYWPKQPDFAGTQPIRLVFFLVRNKEGICTGLLASTVYTGRTGRYGMKLISLVCFAWRYFTFPIYVLIYYC